MKESKYQSINSLNTEDAIALMQTDKNSGLSESQVVKRFAEYGANTIEVQNDSSLVKSIFEQFTNPLALILLVALGLTIFLQEYVDSIVILAAIVINVIISLYQERRAGSAFNALAQKRAHEAVVVRSGKEQVISTTEIVPGDIVLLKAGDYIPADGRVIESNRLSINQVMFTGESEAVSKNADISGATHAFDKTNIVFMGSVVMTGSAQIVISQTSLHTEFGKIADKLASIEKDNSPIQKNLKKIASWLGVATAISLVFVMIVGLAQGGDFYTTLLLAVAVGVSAVPEGLLSAVTVVLAFGAREIMREGGLIKNISSAETLGSASYILTDKTGTLTFGEMKTEGWYNHTGSDVDIEELQRSSSLATDVFFDTHSNRFVGDEMDVAICKSLHKTEDSFYALHSEYTQHDSIPFDSSYKFFASLREFEGNSSIYVKGAPEVLIADSQYVLRQGVVKELSTEDKELYEEYIKEQAEDGRRILAVCVKHNVDARAFQTAWGNDGTASIPEGLVLCGLITFYDKVRSSVPEVIKNMRDSGTRVVMITGDNPLTAHRIALESGIITDEKEAVYIGQDIDQATDEHLLEVIRGGVIKVFARVTPDHKLRLATILQNSGETVAMTGDGVNDAPALQKATIGISLSSSTEVAKEAADLVLLDDSFDTIAFAIAEGRRMLSNLKKTVVYLLSTSFSIVVTLLGSLLLGGPIPFYPTQILWANILEEGLMNFGFLFEPDEKENHSRERGGMLGVHTRNLIIGIGVFNGLLMFGFYFGLVWFGIDGQYLQTYMFGVLSVGNVLFGLAIKSLYDPIWTVKLFSNLYLIVASILSVALFIFAVSVPFIREVLHLQILPVYGYVIIMLYGVVNVLCVELVKKICK